MYEEEAHPKVLAIIERNIRLASLVEKEPRLLQLLNVAASQSTSRLGRYRWETYESIKRTYKEVIRSSPVKEDVSLREYYEAFATGVDELLPVLNIREILQLEFAEPLYDEYREEL